MYITIEGVIGAGKTSLTNLLCENFNAHPVYEVVEENPYLEKFYNDQDKYAFQTEMFFLTDRCNQMRDIENFYINKNLDVIADYHLSKSLIFSKKTLNDNDFEKFEKVYNILVEDFVIPDLIIIIRSDLDVLKKHIKIRNRNMEDQIEDSYLNYLIEKYDSFIEILNKRFSDKLLVINGNEFDFVNNCEDQEKIIKIVNDKLRGVK